MDIRHFLEETARHCYHDKNINCARTALYTLAKLADFTLESQIWAAAVGMHGAGRFGAQCGLVEGTLLFIGIQGASLGLQEKQIVKVCHAYAQAFTQRFGGLECRVLRPGGFRADDPPHLCFGLTLEALMFAADFLVREKFLELPDHESAE